MKKRITIITSAMLLIGTCLLAAPSLDSQMSNLQLKLQRLKKINSLEKAVKTQQKQIEDLTKQLKDTSFQLSVANEKIKSAQIQTESLQNNNATLRSLKAKLEEKLISNQKATIAKYNKQIDSINSAAQKRIDDIKTQYCGLCEKNDNELSEEKSNLEAKLESQKKVLREQLEALIDSVNSHQDKLYSAAQYIADCSDKIGSAVATLKKAYQNVGSPYPEKGFTEKMLTSVGLEKTNPSWQTITDQNNQIRDNILTLREISDSLSKDSLNSKELLKKNQDNSSFLGLL